MEAWTRDSVGPWRDFGATNLAFAEYLLIGLTSNLFPTLLNEEGGNR